MPRTDKLLLTFHGSARPEMKAGLRTTAARRDFLRVLVSCMLITGGGLMGIGAGVVLKWMRRVRIEEEEEEDEIRLVS